GFAAANNQGAELAYGRHLLLLNADTVLLDKNLAHALEYARTNGVAVLGPKMVSKDGTLQRTWDTHNSVGSYLRNLIGLAFFLRHFRREQDPVPSEPMPVRFLVGAALLVSRDAWEEHGLFDERFFFCCEERDLCMRYALAGEQQVYFPGWLIC